MANDFPHYDQDREGSRLEAVTKIQGSVGGVWYLVEARSKELLFDSSMAM